VSFTAKNAAVNCAEDRRVEIEHSFCLGHDAAKVLHLQEVTCKDQFCEYRER
jgi:hypothetical protein